MQRARREGGFAYAWGSLGYLLSRHALELITSVWTLHEMPALAASDYLEDMAVANALSHRCVYAPVRLVFPGTEHWEDGPSVWDEVYKWPNDQTEETRSCVLRYQNERAQYDMEHGNRRSRRQSGRCAPCNGRVGTDDACWDCST